MFCPECGAPNEDDAVFCGNCGAVLNQEALSDADLPPTKIVEGAEPPEDVAPPEPERSPEEEPTVLPASVPQRRLVSDGSGFPPPPAGYATKQTSGMAIASLIMGILGWTLLPWLGSVLALIFGYMARNEIRQRPNELEGDGLAVAGLVLGWLAIGLTAVALCLGVLGFCFLIGVAGVSGGY